MCERKKIVFAAYIVSLTPICTVWINNTNYISSKLRVTVLIKESVVSILLYPGKTELIIGGVIHMAS